MIALEKGRVLKKDKVICEIYLYDTPPVAQYCKPHCLNGILYIQRELERARERYRKIEKERERDNYLFQKQTELKAVGRT